MIYFLQHDVLIDKISPRQSSQTNPGCHDVRFEVITYFLTLFLNLGHTFHFYVILTL